MRILISFPKRADCVHKGQKPEGRRLTVPNARADGGPEPLLCRRAVGTEVGCTVVGCKEEKKKDIFECLKKNSVG